MSRNSCRSLPLSRLAWTLAVLTLLFGAGDLRAQTSNPSGQLVLRVPAALAQEVAARNGLTIVRQVEGQDLFLVTRSTSTTFAPNSLTVGTDSTGGGDLPVDPDIAGIEPNARIATPEVQPELNGSVVSILDGSVVSILDGFSNPHAVSYFNTQVWSPYVDQPATTAIGLAASHASLAGGGIVAIIDTGIDPTHPAFAGSLVPGYDFIHETEGIASEWADVDGSVVSILDGSVVSILDGNTVVTVNGSTVAILDSATAAALDTSLLPHSFGHGTMVAGLVHLVAPGAKIMALKAFQADGTSTVFDVVRAIYYAIDHGARVINMSFSASISSPEIMRAINVATSRGIVCVASAGNLGQETLAYPAALRNVLGIAATNSIAPPLRSAFSNYGDALVSLGAPGEAVITTYPGGHYAAAWGTSFSSPLVAGGAALLVQVDPTVDQQKASDLLGKAIPMGPGMGRGRLNLADAVQTVQDATPPTVTMTAPTSGGSVFGSVLVSASATDNVAVAGVRFLLNGTPIGAEISAPPFQQTWSTTALSNGTYSLTALARDASGNESSSVVSVTVANDTDAPTVALTTPVAGAHLSGTVAVLAAASDDTTVTSVRFLIDGAPSGGEDADAPYELVWNTTAVADGGHTLSAVARDAAGHETTTTIDVVVVNTDAAPTVTLGLTSGATVGGAVSVVATAADDIGVSGVQFTIDGVSAGPEVQTAPYELAWNTVAVANGLHTVGATARDTAGHVTAASVDVTVLNDAAAPTVALSLASGATVGGSVSVVATAADDIGVVGVQFAIDGVSVGSEVATAPYELAWNTLGVGNGSHTVSATARDAAGHVTTASVVVTVFNDVTPPVVTLSLEINAVVAGTVTIAAVASDDVGVTGVELLVDGVPLGAQVAAAPYDNSWDTTAVANGIHTVTATAHDAAGHVTTTSVPVLVAN